MADVIDVQEAEFEERVVAASHDAPVVVDFWAGWCRPCLVLGPVLERLAEEYAGRFTLAKVDVDANPGLAQRFGVQGIPAVKGFVDGGVADEFVGVQPEDLVRRFIDGLLPSPAEPIAREAAEAELAGDAMRAEELYRKAVELDPASERGAIGLARVLLERGEADEARPLLIRFPASQEARGLLAATELRAAAPGAEDAAALRARADADPADAHAAIAAATADAAEGRYEEALERALRIVAARGDGRDEARELMVRVFDTLGADHDLVHAYRPRLARSLY